MVKRVAAVSVGQVLELFLFSLLFSWSLLIPSARGEALVQFGLGLTRFSVGSDNPSGASYSGRVAWRAGEEWEYGLTYMGTSASGIQLRQATIDSFYHLPDFARRVFLGPVLGWGSYSSKSGFLLGVASGCDFPIWENFSLTSQIKFFTITTSGSVTGLDGSIQLKIRF